MARTQRSYPTWDDEFEPGADHGSERRHPEENDEVRLAAWDEDDDWDGDEDDDDSDDDWSDEEEWTGDDDPWTGGDGPLRRGDA